MVNGKQSRVGEEFYKEIEEIKDLRLRNGLDKERISTEKLTNCLVHHGFWKRIKEDLINLNEEGIKEYGK